MLIFGYYMFTSRDYANFTMDIITHREDPNQHFSLVVGEGVRNVAALPAASPTEKPYDYSNRMPTYRPNTGRIPVHPKSEPHSSLETDKIELSISENIEQNLGEQCSVPDVFLTSNVNCL